VGTILLIVTGFLIRPLVEPVLQECGQRLKNWVFHHLDIETESLRAYKYLRQKISKDHSTQGYRKFTSAKSYTNNEDIQMLLSTQSKKSLRLMVDHYIEFFEIGSFSENDQFFAGLELLKASITTEQLDRIFHKTNKNSQATYLWVFLEQFDTTMLSDDAKTYLTKKQAEYEAQFDENERGAFTEAQT
jgi:hypothetical protein